MVMTELVDKYVRILVLVERDSQNTYQEWCCPDCGFPVAQLHNANVLGVNDGIDFDSRHNVLIGVAHHGFVYNGRNAKEKCRARYYFTLGELNG